MVTEAPKIENAQPQERLRLLDVRALVIYHAPGVGGSTLAKGARDFLGIDAAHFFDGGEELRARTGNSVGETGFMPRGTETDRDIDSMQIELIKAASPDNPVVINAKLSWLHAIRLAQTDPSIRVAKVLVTCESEEAARRMKIRKEREIKEKFTALKLQAEEGKISPDKYFQLLDLLNEEEDENNIPAIIERTHDRIKRDGDHFSSMFPELTGVNFYHPDTKIEVGKKEDPKTGQLIPVMARPYDIQISTTHKNKEQSLEALRTELIQGGFAEVVKSTQVEIIGISTEGTLEPGIVLDLSTGNH